MTALDDALDASSVQLGPHQLRALWRESDGTTELANPGTPTDLTKQSTGNFTVRHSLDDGLPDPVTMTTSVDAAGVYSGTVVGLPGLSLTTFGVRAYDVAGGSWDSAAATKNVTSPLPPGTFRYDTVVAAVLINDSTASLVQNVTDPADAWELLGVATDAPLAMYVYVKRRVRFVSNQLTLLSDKNVNFMSTSISFWARNPMDMAIDFRIAANNITNETASTTNHSLTVAARGKSYLTTFWGSASGNAWTIGAGQTQWGNQTANALTLLSAVSPTLVEAGSYTLTATQASANAIACMAALVVEPYERPTMNASQYFSEFNTDSPIYGWDRDTATVETDLRVLTTTGPVDTRVFTGQMQGIAPSANAAEASLDAISRTRIRLNRSLVLPVVSGYREGLTVDWLVTWLAARGSQFPGPCPNRYTRYWAPMYGSIHAHWGPWDAYNVGVYCSTEFPSQLYGYKNMKDVQGKFSTGMFAQQSATRMDRIRLLPRRGLFDKTMSTDDFPHINEAGGPFMFDGFSQANSKGRLCFWLRGDAVTAAPAYLSGTGEDYIFAGYMYLQNKTGDLSGWIELGIDSANRRPYIKMGSDTTGYGTVTFAASGLLPTDGNWHFVGFWWDYAAGTARVAMDGGESSSSFWNTNGYTSSTTLPVTDAQGMANQIDPNFDLFFHLPASDVMLDFGQAYAAGIWADHYPAPSAAPGATMVTRYTRQYLSAIANVEPVNAWDTISELARATLSSYRVNEEDNLEFLPQYYFGETAQMTPSAVQDTSKNTGALVPTVDPTKTRNVVTVQFNDTKVDSSQRSILTLTSSVEIPPGTSNIVFALDVPMVELHGDANHASSSYQIINLTSTQITTPSLPLASHYITVNTRDDGFGSVLPSVRVAASFVSADAISVTIKFVNNYGTTVYLANGGDQVPVMQILGYGVRTSPGYTTSRDAPSVRLRGERGLDSEMTWIHNRAAAADIAARLLTMVGQPRPQLQLTAAGDPRRRPGQMITVMDAAGSNVSGNWRVLAVDHVVAGAGYTQSILAVRVLPPALWDGIDGWDSGVWS